IINSLKNLGKSYSNQKLVRKTFRCLPNSWTSKVTTFEEAKDLTTIPLEQLLGSLMTYETTMEDNECEVIKKKKFFSIRASKEENENVSNMNFKKNPQKEESSKNDEIICDECQKPGHYKNECPKLKMNKEHSKKKKAMMATWSDNDDSSTDEENNGEVAHIVFMAIDKEEEDDEVQFSFNELQSAYEKLFYEYENVNLKNRTPKKNVLCLSKENESLKNENKVLNISLKLSADLKEENEKLKIVDALQKSFSTFSNSSKKLKNLLALQRCVFNKAGLGYDELNN
ncbi:LOW QUALITY PROTEIN: UBN2 domain-containing protein, partial [Cephalotus follicularis]